MSGRARLRDNLEPLASNVYFASEVHDAFVEIGFGPGVSDETSLVLADLSAYYCSRAGCMGQVPGEVVVAAFGVFNPKLIIPHVEAGWKIAGVNEVLAAREKGATASYERLLGDNAGSAARHRDPAARRGCRIRGRALPVCGTAVARHPVDAVGEVVARRRLRAGAPRRLAHRRVGGGWPRSGGGGPRDRGVLRDADQAVPPRSRVDGRRPRRRPRTATARGLFTDDAKLTDAGREMREAIEVATDLQQRPILEAIGDDYDELLEILGPWAMTIVNAQGFPTSVEQLPAAWGRLEAIAER